MKKGLFITGIIMTCLLSGCGKKTGEKAEKKEVAKKFEKVSGDSYNDRKDVKDICKILEDKTGFSMTNMEVTTDGKIFTYSVDDNNNINYYSYDILSGDFNGPLTIEGSSEDSVKLVEGKYLEYVTSGDGGSELEVFDTDFSSVTKKDIPAMPQDEASNYGGEGPSFEADFASSFMYDVDKDVVYYVAGFGSMYSYDYTNSKETQIYKSANVENGSGTIKTTEDISEAIVMTDYGKKDMATVVYHPSTGDTEKYYGSFNYYQNPDKADSNMAVYYKEDCMIYGDNSDKLAFDYISEYENLQPIWNKNMAMTTLYNEVIDENWVTTKLAYAYNVYDMESGQLKASFALDNLDGETYTASFSQDGQKDKMYACDDFGVIPLYGLDGSIKNILVWDYENADIDDVENVEQDLYKLPHTYDDMTCDDMRKQIEDTYDINLEYGDEVKGNDVYDISVTTINDGRYMHGVLSILTYAFSKYPENLFSQLKQKDASGKMTLSIPGILDQNNLDIGEVGITFEENECTHIYVACMQEMCIDPGKNAQNSFKQIFDHELCHGIMNYVDFDAAAWGKFNPPGFSYGENYNAYTDTGDDYTAESGSSDIYFATSYSKVNFDEDVATVYQYLFNNVSSEFYKSEHIKQKVDYFNSLIRAHYDQTGWPEKAIWESFID